MSHKHPPNPARFDVYSELPDRSGFTIKGTEFVFKFDKYGGWFDQFGNYYVCDGVPGDAPSDSESYHSQNQHSHNSHDDEQDQFQKQFGGPNKHFSDEQDETEDIHFSKIAANLVTLNSYPSGKPFRINFRNLPYISKRNEAFEYFRGKVPGILNVIFLQNEKKQFNGNGYFVLEDGKSGESLIRLEGEKYNGREISFSLDSAEDFILDPINDDELYPDFTNKKALKSYITKGKPAQKQEPKKQQFPQLAKVEAKVEVKPQPKQQSPAKVQKKIENEQEFASYIFERKAFPKKSSFNQWIENNKFCHQNDIKQVSKIQGDQNRAKVTMKKKVFNALNGKVQKGVKIIFQPTQK